MDRYLAFLTISQIWLVGSFFPSNSRVFMAIMGTVWFVLAILAWFGNKS